MFINNDGYVKDKGREKTWQFLNPKGNLVPTWQETHKGEIFIGFKSKYKVLLQSLLKV